MLAASRGTLTALCTAMRYKLTCDCCDGQERVGAFKRWLDSRPEKVIVVVGHSTYLKDLTGMNKRLRNGELHTQHI